MGVILLVVLSLHALEIKSIEVDRTNRLLNSIPNDIPSEVTTLRIGYNNINDIGSINYYPSIKYFEAEHNILETFPNLCSLNHTLSDLGLNYNKIDYIEPGRMDCLVNLRSLYIKNNELESIPEVTGMAGSLQVLGIRYNKLTDVPRVDIIGPNVQELQMDGNPFNLHTLAKSLSLINLENLIQLWLQNLELFDHHFDQEVFGRIKMLQFAHFGINKFTAIPDFTFCKNHLRFLYLNNNPIQYIDMDVLRKFTKLESLSCNDCQLTIIPNACSINNNPPLNMALWGNPFICDYRSKWMIPSRDAMAIGIDTFPCVAPSRLTSVPEFILDIEDFQLNDEVRMISERIQLISIDDFRCASLMQESDVIIGVSSIDCTTSCVKSTGCLAIGYHGKNQTCRHYKPGVGTISPTVDLYLIG